MYLTDIAARPGVNQVFSVILLKSYFKQPKCRLRRISSCIFDRACHDLLAGLRQVETQFAYPTLAGFKSNGVTVERPLCAVPLDAGFIR